MLSLVHLKVLASVARTGSVTEAAKELHYSQPSVSHHLARLETATGAKLIQRVGRGIRLTPEGRLLANRATEIVGRVESASNELAAQIGLRAGHVRLAGFQSALSTIVPKAVAALARKHPGIELSLVDVHPVDALRLLRQGEIDVALIFRYADTPAEQEGFRLAHVADDPMHLVSQKIRRQHHQVQRVRVDRRMRTLPGRADVGVSAGGLHSTRRIRQRRHGRHASAGGRRDGCDHPSRPRPPSASLTCCPDHRAT